MSKMIINEVYLLFIILFLNVHVILSNEFDKAIRKSNGRAINTKKLQHNNATEILNVIGQRPKGRGQFSKGSTKFGRKNYKNRFVSRIQDKNRIQGRKGSSRIKQIQGIERKRRLGRVEKLDSFKTFQRNNYNYSQNSHGFGSFPNSKYTTNYDGLTSGIDSFPEKHSEDTKFIKISQPTAKQSSNSNRILSSSSRVDFVTAENEDPFETQLGKRFKFIDIQNFVQNPKGHPSDNGILSTLKNKTFNYAKKFLNLVTVVKFPNESCRRTLAGTEYDEVCLLKSECDSQGGEAVGLCAKGHGVCCAFRYTCGESSNQNCSYFESPGYPNYYPNDTTILVPGGGNNNTVDPRIRWRYNLMGFGRQLRTFSCSFEVFKASDDVKMLRIDFIDFELNGPINGSCVDERFIVTGQNSNNKIPELCGFNSGKHIYVDVSEVSENSPIQLGVFANTVQRRRFKMRICQISDNYPILQNCLQYFTGTSGVISSFNYDQTAMYNRSYPGYLNNLDYTICIKKETGHCSITYSNVQDKIEYPFDLPNINANGMTTIPAAEAGLETFNCPDDFIVINGLRLCGFKLNDATVQEELFFNAPVTDRSNGPFIIPVKTNDQVVGRGFKLFYNQNTC